jgi:phospholipase/carboxylesterase
VPASLVHLVREPTQPSRNAPTLLLLHGVGSNEHDLFGLAPQLDPRCRVISVRAPIELGAGAYGWYEIQFTPNGIIGNLEQARQSLARLVEFVDGLAAERLYVLGFSQGAIMTLALALTHPEKVVAAAALSGRFLLNDLRGIAEPERLRGLPILVQHGLYDEVLPIENGRGIRDALAQLPVELTYQEYPIGHHISPESLAAVQSWLSALIP